MIFSPDSSLTDSTTSIWTPTTPGIGYAGLVSQLSQKHNEAMNPHEPDRFGRIEGSVPTSSAAPTGWLSRRRRSFSHPNQLPILHGLDKTASSGYISFDLANSHH